VLPESKTVENPDNIAFIVGVSLFETLQNASLNESLFVQTLLVFEYFQCDWLIMLMIVAMEYLTERTFPDLLFDLVSVVHVVF